MKHLILIVLVITLWLQATGTASATDAVYEQWEAESEAIAERQEWPALLKHSREGIEKFPHVAEPYWSLFRAHFYLEENTSAKAALVDLMDKVPGAIDSIKSIADRAISDRSIDLAEVTTAALVEFDQSAETLRNRGIALMWQARYVEAGARFLAALQTNPHDEDALLYSSILYIDSREYDAAIDQLQLLTKINQDNASAWYHLGRVTLKSGGSRETVENSLQRLEMLGEQKRADDLRSMVEYDVQVGNKHKVSTSSSPADYPVDTDAVPRTSGILSDRDDQEDNNSCRRNSDCPFRQSCHKPAGSFVGVCGVLVDEIGMREPDAQSAKQCSFNTDCSVGFRCQKSLGKIVGICVR